MKNLFDPYPLGSITLTSRVVMAPMTRARRPDLIPGTDTAEYYRQRAGAGLIITEGVFVSPEAQGYSDVPGLWTGRQTAGWAGVTKAVHGAGGRIFAQLWHVGRVSHTSLQPAGAAPVGPSAVQARANAWIKDVGFVEASVPRALRTDEIPRLVADFAGAGARAVQAGFDGVELGPAAGEVRRLWPEVFKPDNGPPGLGLGLRQRQRSACAGTTWIWARAGFVMHIMRRPDAGPSTCTRPGRS
ncbi:hypothetical protein ACFWBN_00325 [Streptomyces sp. NPDC059989]|uniref:oxidoreductase n=1 Tax=Streptomyces sp. NPDC059989 TaxID=3347026 RepID=UPI0036C50898